MTRIKICGLFNECDIDFVNETKPDFIGFVFAESRRQVTCEKASALQSGLAPEIAPVGVFVDAPAEIIVRLYHEGIIRIAQLHGQEDEDYIRLLKDTHKIPVIKAIRVESSEDIRKWQSSSADYLLFDKGAGGTGEVFDWNLIAAVKKPYFLAGGIRLGNIGAALSIHPYCVDISSGAETNGVKDRDKIRCMVNEVRKYSQIEI